MSEPIRLDQDLDRLRKNAEAGDRPSMEKLALFYLKKDNPNFVSNRNKRLKEAFQWFDRARIEGGLCGLAHCGWMLLMGEGVKKNTQRGLVYLSVAAERGSDVAAYWLGNAFFEGHYGLAIDLREARYWLQRSINSDCTCQNLAYSAKVAAQKKLNWVFRNKPEMFPRGTRPRPPGGEVPTKTSLSQSKNNGRQNRTPEALRNSVASLKLDENTKQQNNALLSVNVHADEKKEEEINKNQPAAKDTASERQEGEQTKSTEKPRGALPLFDEYPDFDDASHTSHTSEATEKRSGNPIRSSSWSSVVTYQIGSGPRASIVHEV